MITTLRHSISLLSLFLLLNSICLRAQTHAERIKQVENSLSPLVSVEGQPLWNLTERMERYQTPGLSVTVIEDFQVAWTKGYGYRNRDRAQPVTDQTVFQAGSISKFVNALAMIKLREFKSIELDADINDLMSSWSFPYEDGSPTISLRQLLGHSAGLSVSGFAGYKNANNLPGIIDILEGKNPANSKAVVSIIPANQEFMYSGGGTMISQLILMDNSEMTYENYVHQNIFGPIKLDNAFYSIQKEWYREDMAYGHTRKGKALKSFYHYYPESAAAGLWTTTSDLAELLIQFQLSLTEQDGKIVSHQGAREMIKPVLSNSNAALGLFVDSQNDQIYLQHSAATRGFRGKFIISAEGGNGVVILTNGTQTELLEEIIRSVAMTYNWEGFELFKKDTRSTLSDAELKNYIGTYTFKKRAIAISEKNGVLFLSEKGKWSSALTPLDKYSYLVEKLKPTAAVTFIKNEAGQVSKLIIKQGKDVLEWKKSK